MVEHSHPEIILYDATRAKWLRFCQPEAIFETDQVDQVCPLLKTIEQKVTAENLYAVGFLSYEAAPAFDPAFRVREDPLRFPLLWFGLFPTFQIIDLTSYQSHSFRISHWSPTTSREEYTNAIRSIKRNIAQGLTYQVNYTIRLNTQFEGDPKGLFRQIVSAQKANYPAFLDLGDFVICSASPELFFEVHDGHVVCRPMKGTARRGLSSQEDQSQATALFHSEKNRAENVMIVDMIRNDLGRIAKVGSVKTTRLFEIERYPTVWQMTSTVEADTDASLTELFTALFPCASITGAPKISTMKIIAQLETEPRRIYTGCIGFITPEKRAQFNVAIRTILIHRRTGMAEYGVGGGIVWDSTSEGEYEECQIKARLLTHVEPEFDLLETMLWTAQEGYFLLAGHLSRLEASAAYFKYPFPQSAIEKALSEAESSFSSSPQRVRLLLNAKGEVRLQSQPLIPLPEPQRLVLAKHPIDSKNVFLYHKTTFREAYEKERAENTASTKGCEILFWNERGEVTESEIANLVVRLKGRLLTPPLTSGLLPGVFRQWLLDRGEIEEHLIHLSDLAHCEELFLINSVRKWRRAVLV
ncbi:MAG: Para-aminobenzoate synthase, aminase component [Anaerolineae bacterium]|nr:MAG: Para-aminobenzoate synthase, aminase component [Anaerolineae bacterium]